ncbi:DUF934 domain-containing protein [Ampullimonas aquatilis]|uniref:DUF934 domain-containing protein n=1 Tax=Ampullimonas aquatilis TaxID=1341549 RepID=UPI003C757E82
MPDTQLIKNQQLAQDTYQLIRLKEGETAASIHLPEGALIVPLAVWFAQEDLLQARVSEHHWPIGVWLAPEEDPAELAEELTKLALIAVDFPASKDGRGYSAARLLRERYGYKGELRAIGDVLHDEIFYMQRCGFNSFVMRADQDINAAATALNTFGVKYQGAYDDPVPLFRKRFPAAI